ncbi:MAG: hypothetical protein LBL58_00405 [Tannerellaceae bacterium]|jgi:hypothetical protein|nr:hypothetical protein [Tannerellaceae bacterium]
MGFLESLGKAMEKMAKIVAPQEQATEQAWAEELTLEQIEEYERQGLDMSPYRKMREDKIAARQKLIDDSINAMALGKLDKYKKARSAEDAFVTDVAKFNGISDKNKAKLELAPLVYGRVVQAFNALYDPNENTDNAGIVFVFALDDAHCYDEAWLAKTAERISEMKEGGTVPPDCQKFIETLRDDSSYFCVKLGESLSEGADAWCATYWLKKQSQLPLGYIPHCRIIPFLLSTLPTHNNVEIELIPPDYYSEK